jgi:hypothetical protein
MVKKDSQKKMNNKPSDFVEKKTKFFTGIGSQQKMFDYAYEDDDFYLVKQLKTPNGFTNTYCSFYDINSFLKFRSTRRRYTAYNELIREGQACLEYYDCDAKWSDGWNSIEEYVQEFLKLRQSFDSKLYFDDVEYEDLVITESCNETKLSLHIIIRHTKKKYHITHQQRYFENTKDHKIFASTFANYIKTSHPKSKIKIDLSVYNKNSIMRCIDSYKIGDKKRVFKAYGRSKDITDMRKFYVSYLEKICFVGHYTNYCGSYYSVTEPEKEDNIIIHRPIVSDEKELETCKIFIEIIKKDRADNYQEWCSIGSALYSTLNGSKEGFELFCDFSRQSEEKFNYNSCVNIWRGFGSSTSLATKGTLVYYYNLDKLKLKVKRKKIM